MEINILNLFNLIIQDLSYKLESYRLTSFKQENALYSSFSYPQNNCEKSFNSLCFRLCFASFPTHWSHRQSQVGGNLTCVRTCNGWPNGFASYPNSPPHPPPSHSKKEKKNISRRKHPVFYWLIKICGRHWTELTSVGWKTFFGLHANFFSIKRSASNRKCAQGLSKCSRKETQIFNMRLLASLFGQGSSSIIVNVNIRE